jgi:hypothetical protein
MVLPNVCPIKAEVPYLVWGLPNSFLRASPPPPLTPSFYAYLCKKRALLRHACSLLEKSSLQAEHRHTRARIACLLDPLSLVCIEKNNGGQSIIHLSEVVNTPKKKIAL